MLLQRLRKAQAAKDANRAEQICKLRQDGAASQGTSTCAHCGLHLRHKTNLMQHINATLELLHDGGAPRLLQGFASTLATAMPRCCTCKYCGEFVKRDHTCAVFTTMPTSCIYEHTFAKGRQSRLHLLPGCRLHMPIFTQLQRCGADQRATQVDLVCASTS
ncbi:unnamed protein product [Symbiodinium microadriaticum]|nr:unnamed protein product [Symbiodinium microadriaticum]